MVKRKLLTPLAMLVAAATLMLGAGQANAGDFSIGVSIGGHGHHGYSGHYRYRHRGHQSYGHNYGHGYSGHHYRNRGHSRGYYNHNYRGYNNNYNRHRRYDHFPSYRRSYRPSCGY